MTKKRCIATTKTTKKCKNSEYHDKLCFQHYNICYKEIIKVKIDSIIVESIDDTENNVIDIDIVNDSCLVNNCIDESDNCSICLEKNGYKYINKTCCNYKFHYKCLETFLCMCSTELRCPVCKVEYTKDNIHNIFTNYQIDILYKRIFQNIYDKSKYIYKLNQSFSYSLKEINHYERQVLTRVQQDNGEETFKDILVRYRDCIIIHKQHLINYYSKVCKKLKEIEKDLKKTNIIRKNYSRTIDIYNRNKYYIDRMKTVLINCEMI